MLAAAAAWRSAWRRTSWRDLARLPSQPGVAATLGLLVLGAAAVRVATARQTALIAVGGAAVLVAGRVSVRHEYILPLAFLGLLAWGGALGVGVWLRFVDARHQLAVDAARRDERLELARELHDVVAHHVAGIVVQAQAARLVAARRPETLEPRWRASSRPAPTPSTPCAGWSACSATRATPGGVTPGPEAARRPGRPLRRPGPAVRLRLPDDGQASWPPEVASTVYRVVQEALTNVVLHAPGAAEVTVTVGNAAVGGHRRGRRRRTPAGPSGPFWFARGGGHGLVGMRERVEALGGTLQGRAGPGRRLGGAGRAPARAGSGR